MDVDFKRCKVRVERERWLDSQGNPHEWLSFISEPITHMESIIDEFRRQNEVNSIFHILNSLKKWLAPCLSHRKTIIVYIRRLLKFVVRSLIGTSDSLNFLIN